MAKQAGVDFIEGCYDNIVFYKLGEGYYARTKSSLTGKRVKKDPAFKNTMMYAGLLANAAGIASKIYRLLPANKKEKGMYKKLVGKIMYLLKEKKTREEIINDLSVHGKKIMAVKAEKRVCEQRILFADAVIQKAFAKCFYENKKLLHAPG